MQEPDKGALGKLPKRSDSRTLQLPALSPHPLALPALIAGKTDPEVAVDNEKAVTQPWDWLGNDSIRDCACAAAGHAETLWDALYGGGLPEPTREQIVDDYSKITHYKQDDDTTDKGADLLTVLKYWQSTGIAGQQIKAFAEIPVHDIDTLKWSIASFGVAYIGFKLPSACVAADNKHFSTRRTVFKPATWGNPGNGHCVIYTGYDSADWFTCVTWNRVMTVPPDFHRAYCDEAYAIIPPEPADGDAEKAGFTTLDEAAGLLDDVTGPRQALLGALDQLEFLDAALDRAKSVPRR